MYLSQLQHHQQIHTTIQFVSVVCAVAIAIVESGIIAALSVCVVRYRKLTQK